MKNTSKAAVLAALHANTRCTIQLAGDAGSKQRKAGAGKVISLAPTDVSALRGSTIGAAIVANCAARMFLADGAGKAVSFAPTDVSALCGSKVGAAIAANCATRMFLAAD